MKYYKIGEVSKLTGVPARNDKILGKKGSHKT